MSSLTGRGERLPSSIRGADWRSPVQRGQCDPVRFSFFGRTEGGGGARSAPDGAPPRIMCQRANDVPSGKSLSGSVGDRIRSFGGGTLCRGSVPARESGFGRSERKVTCCEKCSASLVALKKQALSLAVHHHFSCKDIGELSAFLHDNLRVHGRDREQGECLACGRSPHQLKQEAIHLAMSRGQSLAKPPIEAGVNTGTLLGQSEARRSERPPKEAAMASHQLRSHTYSPHSPRSPSTPQRTPQTLRRRGPKLPEHDMDRWVEAQQQLVASKSTSNSDGVSRYTYHQVTDDTTLSCGELGTVQASSKIPHISRVVNIANTAAMSFLARAAEKLNLTLRKRGQASDPAPSNLSTCFREIVQKNPLPVPPCLLQAATRSKDSPIVGKVKVVLRVSPSLSEEQGHPPVLRIDPSNKRVTIMEPITKSQPYGAMTLGRDGNSLLKTFNFDAAYPQESSQAEVSAGVLADVIRCVLSGSDGCVLGLGCADVGSWSSMVGSGESHQKLGVIPCAISWLYSAIDRHREKTWTDLTVSVSAMELCSGDEDTLRDLLGEVVPSSGSTQDSPKAHVKIQEDPVNGIQLRNHNRVKAPTAERAASLLDAALAARRHSDFITYLSHSSVMFFTLHVQPPRTESTIGRGLRSSTKLTLIDVCSGMRGMSKNKPPHAELGSIVLSLLNGHKTTPSKSSKLTMLLRESLGYANCHIAVMADVVDSFKYLHETFSTIQLASRIRKTQKRAKQSTSCSPCGRSLTREKRGPPSLSLRAFHSTDEVDVDTRPFRLRRELDERSSSDQSCDTVIQIDLDGLAHSKTSPRLAQPEFVPIIPSLHPNKADLEDAEFTALLQELLRIPQLQGEKKTEEAAEEQADLLGAVKKKPERDCLKCDTFAELQERLGCIDGSEITIDLLRSSLNGACYSKVTTKSQSQREPGTQGHAEVLEAPQTSLNQGSCCTQTSVREKVTDGAFPGDSFQREDSGLYDCEECSANSSSEELLNQATSLNLTSRSELPSTRTLKSGHDPDFDVDSKSKVAHQPSEKQPNAEVADWSKLDKRESPIGKSSPISPSSSCSSSHSMAKSVVLGDVLHNRPAQDGKEMKATITVTVQQPLDQKGQDELVFSMVEEVTISGAYERGSTGGNIICIRDPAQSQGQGQCSTSSQPIQIISNISEESAAASSSEMTKRSEVLLKPTHVIPESPKCQSKRERGFLPSFINPMLIDTNVEGDLSGAKGKEFPPVVSVRVKSAPESQRSSTECPKDGKFSEKKSSELSSVTHVKNFNKSCYPSKVQISYNTLDQEDVCNKHAVSKCCEQRPHKTDQTHLRDSEYVYSSNSTMVSEGGAIVCRHVGSIPKRSGVEPSCQETTLASSKTGSLPRAWQGANHQDSYSGCHMTNNHRDSRGVTSFTPCSPGVTLERRQGKLHSTANHTLHISSPRKIGSEFKGASSPVSKKCVESLFDTSSLTMKHEHAKRRLRSPVDDSSRLFNSKLEQLVSQTNSLGRIPREFPAGLERGGSSTSISSKGSLEGSSKTRYKVNTEGDSTFPRASRSPRKNPRSDQSHHFFPSEKPSPQSSRHHHSKLSAVSKLKISTPKVRRLSAPSIKNLSLSHKNLHQSINRSASLSPDGKIVNYERTSSFFSSSPPRSFRSVSRTPSQSSTCSSTKSAIQGFVNGRISDLLKERPTSPTSVGLDHMASLPSPYSQVTAPRMPDHMSGHASDTTSVLSGDLPPAMGKTSLHFSNRSSLVSSGYGSMARDGEVASNRDSVSDRSGSVLSVARSSRSSRRRGNAGAHHRRQSHDTPRSQRRSASCLHPRWLDKGIPEAYEIKVYEIDNMQKMQKRTGPSQLQCQAEVCGSSAAEDLRGSSQMQQPAERAGASQAVSSPSSKSGTKRSTCGKPSKSTPWSTWRRFRP